jgi:carbon storage regulator
VLVLTRRQGESIRIGSDVRVTIVTSSGGQVRIAIDAPMEVGILREELFEKVAAANLEAASATGNMISGLAADAGVEPRSSGGNDHE